jgi:integrase
MPRKAIWPPPIHQKGGSDIIRIRHRDGTVEQVTLGKSGSDFARREYVRIISEYESQLQELSRGSATIKELVESYLEDLASKNKTSNLQRVKTAAKPLIELYGHLHPSRLTPIALKTVRAKLVEQDYCRRLINQHVDCIRLMWSWAVSEEIVEESVHRSLKHVRALRKGEEGTRDHPKISAVDLQIVEQTLPHLGPIVADMVRVLMLTGMRPGEVCEMTPGMINRNWLKIGEQQIWLYDLAKHKTAYRGHLRQIPISPKCQQILESYLADRADDQHLFSPLESARHWFASKGRRFPRKLSRQYLTRYDTASFGAALRKGCKRAKVVWHANQIRHSVATKIETQMGREDARVVMGHTTPTTTSIYAEGAERAARALLALE